jgi:hypothetical protein
MKDESSEGTEKTEFCVYENIPTERSTSSYVLQIIADNTGARLERPGGWRWLGEPAAQMNHTDR